MYESTLELITLVSSNSHLAFCFCNVIIGILFVSSSISSPSPSTQQKSHGFRISSEGNEYTEEDEKSSIKIGALPSSPNNRYVSGVVKVEVPICHEEPIMEGEYDKNDEDQGEDELRRRAEEFIAKVNRAWMAEKYGTFSPQLHREQLEGNPSRSRSLVV